MFFFPAIVAPAMVGGYGPALLASALSTLVVDYFFVPPIYGVDVSADDFIRLAVFASVALTTAWLSSRRHRAETAQRRTLAELSQNVATLQKVARWPLHIGDDIAVNARHVLDHAMEAAGARAAAVIWETDDEPWRFVVTTAAFGLVTLPALAATGTDAVPPEVVQALDDPAPTALRFETEQIVATVYLSGVDRAKPEAVELVAREVGNSLSRLYLADRLRQLAVREDRIRVSRDLHDGILQALTGIRLELQSVAAANAPAAERLEAAERALAKEQRELRFFIDELKPHAGGIEPPVPIALRLEEIRGRLAEDWRVPITLRVAPPDLVLPSRLEHAVRLMVHEGVSNALRHAHPSRVAVDVERAASSDLVIVVSDNGCGFPFRGRLEHHELLRANAGPISLRERVTALDGRLTVESGSSGSRVELVIPIAAAAPS